MVWSQMDITKILADFNLAVVKWDRQTAKFNSLPNFQQASLSVKPRRDLENTKKVGEAIYVYVVTLQSL